MAEFFLMPKLGMDMEEGIIARWIKNEGDAVSKGELIAEIETDKAAVEVESPVSGTILKVFFDEESEVPCGQPIAVIGQPGEAIPDPDSLKTNNATPSKTENKSTPTAANDMFFLMPKLGMDMEEGMIVKWLKAEGETVNKGEPFVEIETDKAAVVSEATISGVVLKLYYEEDASVPCGSPIAAIGAPGQIAPELDAICMNTSNAEPAQEAPVVETQQEISVASTHQYGDRVIASPRARRCASEKNVDLHNVFGTGENGRIVEQDVLDFAAAGVGIKKIRVAQDEVVPLSGMRKIIANRMRSSQQEMAQTNTRMDVDMSNMIAFRKQLNARLEKDGIKVSYVDLLTAVCAQALIENPQANASLQADGIHYKNYANIGIAVDSEKGLVVPVVKDADILSIQQISKTNREMIEKARKGALTPDDMRGGTFTISNLGMFEVDSFTAIVNPPETCILAVGRIADRAVVENGQVVVRPMMNLCLSYDHCVIDGAPAARFLQCIKHYLENPVWLLM